MSALGKSALALCSLLAAALLCAAPAAAAEYELESVFTDLSSYQAGEHADLTIGFELSEEGGEPTGFTRDVHIKTPPGVIGNPQAMPSCTLDQFGNNAEESQCPQDAQVGVAQVSLAGTINSTLTEPVYNMPAPPDSDIVARFGLYAGPFATLINVRIDPVDYSLVASAEGAPSAAELLGVTTTLWGVPAADEHDALRLTPVEALNGELPPGGRPSGQPLVPFLSNPTDCSLDREVTITALSYGAPDKPSTLSAPFPEIGGCEKLKFEPAFSVIPTNPEAAAPTGLNATLTIPQDEAPGSRATSTLRGAVVTLPQGMTINPAAGDGLGSCSAAQVGFADPSPPECPESAKIGTVEVDAPALERTLHGAAYQRTPEDGELFRFWLVTDELGVRLKLPAEIQANPLTGQLTTVFNGVPSLGGNPQFPFEELRLHVFSGPRAPLATPSACGTYHTAYQFTPWSGRPPAEGTVPMQITTGCDKGGFAPRLAAGTTNPAAGEFSPFTMTLTRQDGESNPESLAVHLPQGLLAKLAGVPLCPEAAAATGACPAASKVGSLAAASGVGTAPLWIPQPGKDPTAIYLAGPYKGAPYSIVAVVPAQAGPFDLGLVVNRSGIYVDPVSATATVKTDPLPQILEGVPIAYRAVNAVIDRPSFTLNGTDCTAKQITATVTASDGAVATPSDGYQPANCARLPYKPKLKLTLKGATRRSGHPAVRAVFTQPPGQANNAAITTILPPTLFIDQDHINNPCTRVQFNQGACPPLSILGTATATTPLLDEPLSGPVYFRSNGGERELPDIVIDLHGPFRITQVGFVDAVTKKGSETSRIRTRFLSVPDAPVSKLTLSLLGGKKRGLLENSENLCKTNRLAKVHMVGQNGRVVSQNQRIATSCDKKRKAKKQRKRRR